MTNTVFGQLGGTGIPAQCQGIRRRRDEVDIDEGVPPSRRQHMAPVDLSGVRTRIIPNIYELAIIFKTSYITSLSSHIHHTTSGKYMW